MEVYTSSEALKGISSPEASRIAVLPLLSEAECAEIVAAAAAYGWGEPRYGHAPSRDVPACALNSPTLQRARAGARSVVASVLAVTTGQVREVDASILLYTAGEGLCIHRDRAAFTATVLLSPRTDFEGGGTLIPALSAQPLQPPRGHVLCHCGRLRHAGVPISSGQRVLLVMLFWTDRDARLGEQAQVLEGGLPAAWSEESAPDPRPVNLPELSDVPRWPEIPIVGGWVQRLPLEELPLRQWRLAHVAAISRSCPGLPGPLRVHVQRKVLELLAGPERCTGDDLLQLLVARLWAQRGREPRGQTLTEEEVTQLCTQVQALFLEEPALLELSAPVTVVGKLAGQHLDLLRVLGSVAPPREQLLVLGNIVNRGPHSLDTLCLLLAYKVLYPRRIFLLRGMFECGSISRIYGFFDECKRVYHVKLWKTFCGVFDCMPLAARIDGSILCVSAGISREWHELEDVNRLHRPTDIPDQGFLCDLMWSSLDTEARGWRDEDKGVSFTYGPDALCEFLARNGLEKLCVGNQVVEEGIESAVRGRHCRICSAPRYCGEFGNSGAVLHVGPQLQISASVMPTSAYAA